MGSRVIGSSFEGKLPGSCALAVDLASVSFLFFPSFCFCCHVVGSLSFELYDVYVSASVFSFCISCDVDWLTDSITDGHFSNYLDIDETNQTNHLIHVVNNPEKLLSSYLQQL